MITEKERQEAADALLRAEVERKPNHPAKQTYPDLELEDAYRYKRSGADADAKGARIVGHKIGLTSRGNADGLEDDGARLRRHSRRRSLQ